MSYADDVNARIKNASELPINSDGSLNDIKLQSQSSSGNTGLPFGLCKKFGIKVPENATPRQAWNLLKYRTGLDPSEIYKHIEENGEFTVDKFNELSNAESKRQEDERIKKEKQREKTERTKAFFQDRAKKDLDFFFGDGNWEKVTNKYYRIKHAINDNEIILNTNNVKMIKDNPVLITGNNQAVYLKNWQIREAHSWDDDGADNFYLVKLNRQFFKPYTFRNDFYGYSFSQPDTFDELLKTAKEQDERNRKIALGHMNI